ncbi:MAG: LLM class flavin-dependent oxidoreductase [Theionarchaea archaeon]|nr:LLM class flavin-dependent oxidoreductase [Theionarchaea archaeon]
MKYCLNVANFGAYSDIRLLVELACEAENAGWEGFFLWDHMIMDSQQKIPFVDPWIALSAIAMKTESMKIGTMITPLPRRRPWKLAREIISLDHLSQGRLIVGIGLGNPPEEYSIFGEPSMRNIQAQKLDEGLEIIDGLLSGNPFTFSGIHYQIEEVTFLPTPYQSRIPVWIAGMWPHRLPFQRAARWDGVVPISVDYTRNLSPGEIAEIVEYVDSHRVRDDPFDMVVIGETPAEDDKALQTIAPYITAGASWWSESIHGWRGSLEENRKRIQKGPPHM